jgi:hypothetical protein
MPVKLCVNLKSDALFPHGEIGQVLFLLRIDEDTSWFCLCMLKMIESTAVIFQGGIYFYNNFSTTRTLK